MSTPSNILHPRSPRRYYRPPNREIASTHIHFCPRCKEEYAGYVFECPETKERLCGKCLAETFNAG